MKKTPRRAIVLHCRECIENGRPKDCKIDTCPSWPLREGHKVSGENGKNISPLKTIRKHCLDCCCDSYTEVEGCSSTDCQLWEYRFGHNPKLAGIVRGASKAKKEQFEARLHEASSEGINTFPNE